MARLGSCVSAGCAAAAVIAATAVGAFANQQVIQAPLPGKNIPKFVEPVPVFGPAGIPRVQALAPLTVTMEEFDQQVLPAANPALGVAGYPKTTVWGYNVGGSGARYPGVTIEATQGSAASVTYVNNIGLNGPSKLQKLLTVDQTLHWADPLSEKCPMTRQSLVCGPAPIDPCCTPYGYPSWPGAAVAASALPNESAPVPTVVHLHGAEVPSTFDGHPDSWFTFNSAIHGPAYTTAQYTYPNLQEPTTLWFHDHALGTTRLNVFGGLAAFYLLRDTNESALNLPAGPQEVELLIQDRMFDTNGQWLFPDTGVNPATHPFWIPEFFGDVIVVNGKSWPYLNVEPRRYRFRIVNGSNARFYNLALVDGVTGPTIWQIGTDGGFLDNPAPIAPPARLLLAPAERADIIIDFSRFGGKTLTLANNAKAPFPSGAPADPATVGQIMQFRVGKKMKVADTSCDPAGVTGPACVLRTPMVRLANPTTGTLAPAVKPDVTRQLVLREIDGPGGPLEVLLNNTKWMGVQESTMASNPVPVAGSTQVGTNWLTELPKVGATELWEIVNTTADAHPIHLHLIQFQIVNRQPFMASKYMKAYLAAFPAGVAIDGYGPPYSYDNATNPTFPAGSGVVGGNPNVVPYLKGAAVPPAANEAGWKDTVVMHPGEVTRIAVRYAPQAKPAGTTSAGTNYYSFDPSVGPGYVWHCHILDHEDNEMMRPYALLP